MEMQDYLLCFDSGDDDLSFEIHRIDNQIYTPKGAAIYLGISLEQFNTYSIRQKRIPFSRHGNTRLFYKSDLDRFNTQERRKRGNPNV